MTAWNVVLVIKSKAQSVTVYNEANVNNCDCKLIEFGWSWSDGYDQEVRRKEISCDGAIIIRCMDKLVSVVIYLDRVWVILIRWLQPWSKKGSLLCRYFSFSASHERCEVSNRVYRNRRTPCDEELEVILLICSQNGRQHYIE